MILFTKTEIEKSNLAKQWLERNQNAITVTKTRPVSDDLIALLSGEITEFDDVMDALEREEWATIMQAALDALLVQLPEEIQIDLSPAGLPTIEHLQDFVIIPLRGPLRDGDFVWALTLPTIRPTNTAPVPQDE